MVDKEISPYRGVKRWSSCLRRNGGVCHSLCIRMDGVNLKGALSMHLFKCSIVYVGFPINYINKQRSYVHVHVFNEEAKVVVRIGKHSQQHKKLSNLISSWVVHSLGAEVAPRQQRIFEMRAARLIGKRPLGGIFLEVIMW